MHPRRKQTASWAGGIESWVAAVSTEDALRLQRRLSKLSGHAGVVGSHAGSRAPSVAGDNGSTVRADDETVVDPCRPAPRALPSDPLPHLCSAVLSCRILPCPAPPQRPRCCARPAAARAPTRGAARAGDRQLPRPAASRRRRAGRARARRRHEGTRRRPGAFCAQTPGTQTRACAWRETRAPPGGATASTSRMASTSPRE